MVQHFSRDLERHSGDILFLIPNIYRTFLMLGMMELVECIFQMYLERYEYISLGR